MKRNEIIELNGVEYTLEINRESSVKIEQYTNFAKSMEQVRKPVINYIDEISDDENPFATEIDFDKMQEEAETKLNTLHKIIERAFWVWLYPNHKLNIKEVKKIIEPYYETDEKMEFISKKYSEYLKLSTEITDKYVNEQKNLKALASK